jgi:hypothetical protein
MPTAPTTRQRRQSDQYFDPGDYDEHGTLRDGRTARFPMHLVDSSAGLQSRFTPPTPPGRFAYKRGYLSDASTGYIVDARSVERISDPTQQGGWPQQTSNVVPAFNNKIGAPCRCESGEAGTLQPHPTIASSLYCVPDRRDAESVYRQSVLDAEHEWKRYGPRRDASIADPSPPQQRPWPRGGYVDPSQGGSTMWPNPDTLHSQRPGDQCTLNGQAGHLQARGNNLVCIPDRNGRDADIVAPMGTFPVGGSWPEGCACDLGNGEYGVLVKEGDRLVCRERQVGNGDASVDHQAIRDASYHAMCEQARNAWRGENWPRS